MKTLIAVGILGGLAYVIYRLLLNAKQEPDGQVQYQANLDPVKRPPVSMAASARNLCEAGANVGVGIYGASSGVPPQGTQMLANAASGPMCAMGVKAVQSGGTAIIATGGLFQSSDKSVSSSLNKFTGGKVNNPVLKPKPKVPDNAKATLKNLGFGNLVR